MIKRNLFSSDLDYIDHIHTVMEGRSMVDDARASYGENFDANRYAHLQYRLEVLTHGPNIAEALTLERCIDKLLTAMTRGDSVAVERLTAEEKDLYEKYKVAIRQWRIKHFDAE